MINFNNAITNALNQEFREHFIRCHVEMMSYRKQAEVAHWILDTTRIGLAEETVRRVSNSKDFTQDFVDAFPLPFYRWLKIYLTILITYKVNGLNVSPWLIERFAKDRRIFEI